MKKTLAVVLIIFNCLIVKSQILQPVKWKSYVQKHNDSIAHLVFKATIDPGWHLYAQDVPPGGPVPTTFSVKPGKHFTLIGKVYPVTKAHDGYDSTFEMNIKFYENSATFVQPIKILSNEKFTVEATVEFMACNNITCITPQEVDFSFTIDGSQYKIATLNVVSKDKDTISSQGKTPHTVVSSDKSTTLNHDQKTSRGTIDVVRPKRSIWGIILEAIIWGLLAILTPCVFPMIPMTVSFFLKSNQGSKIRARFNATFFGINIVALYTLPIAFLIGITYLFGGESVTADIFNWLSTHWLPNIIFFLIFFIFALSFFGAFEIVLPHWMVNRADRNADRGGMLGTFFMALVLVLVSFSCTGPIVGTIIVKSLQGDIWEPVITMLAFSIAFALPFSIFAYFPQWLEKLPKSGGWMNMFKVTLGFLELALGLKFLSVADQVYHWRLLDREVYLAIWIVIFSLLGMYYLGIYRFKHDDKTDHISIGRLMLAIVTFSFVLYLIPGMWGAPLKALSGYLPPQQTHDFDIQRIIREEIQVQLSMMGNANPEKSDLYKLCEKPKYEDILPPLPHGLQGYHDLEQALRCSKKLQKPVFVDFTGHGCVNCREMEARVWSHPEVLKRLKNNFIVCALYVDDKTELPENEWVKSTYDGKIKKTIGKKYADLQVTRYKINAQPYYVILDTAGHDLVEPKAYDLNVDNFIQFLDNALKEFNNRMNK
ncbi:MAG: protein-disulfide reductase DsbD family protein [Bacteroidales bacterium]|nr:protein-disulfide reductase DsbD family protein [Bacteroidales bacterium]